MEQSRNQRMLEQFTPGHATLMPGAHNALSARIIEAAGFETLMFTGAGFANTYLGVPDMGLTSLKEVVDQVAAIRDAVNIPILADGDTGFGNALNARRTVRMVERAGANALRIEDQGDEALAANRLARRCAGRGGVVQRAAAVRGLRALCGTGAEVQSVTQSTLKHY